MLNQKFGLNLDEILRQTRQTDISKEDREFAINITTETLGPPPKAPHPNLSLEDIFTGRHGLIAYGIGEDNRVKTYRYQRRMFSEVLSCNDGTEWRHHTPVSYTHLTLPTNREV